MCYFIVNLPFFAPLLNVFRYCITFLPMQLSDAMNTIEYTFDGQTFYKAVAIRPFSEITTRVGDSSIQMGN